jgi:hypothetical protein
VVVVATSGGAGGVGTGGTEVFNGEVPPDGTFLIDGAASPTNDPGWIGPNIYVDDGAESADDTNKTSETDDGTNGNAGGNSNGKGGGSDGNGNNDSDGKAGGDRPEGVKIHTSCSESLRVGDVYGGRYKVFAATTTDGERICGTEAN